MYLQFPQFFHSDMTKIVENLPHASDLSILIGQYNIDDDGLATQVARASAAMILTLLAHQDQGKMAAIIQTPVRRQAIVWTNDG